MPGFVDESTSKGDPKNDPQDGGDAAFNLDAADRWPKTRRSLFVRPTASPNISCWQGANTDSASLRCWGSTSSRRLQSV